MARTNRRWSYSAGERGRNRVRVYEDPKSSSLLMEFYEDGRRVRRALKHASRTTAKQQADEAAARIGGQRPLKTDVLRVGRLFDMYLAQVTPTKSEHKQKHDRRAAAMFVAVFGRDRTAPSLNRGDWDRFIADRSSGRLMGRKVGPRTVEIDLRYLRAVLNWATQTRGPDGQFLLDVNPLRGLKPPVELNPQRPGLSSEEYESLLAIADKVDWRYRLALVLAHETGHRIGAIRQLMWSDIDLTGETVLWRGEVDKQGREHSTPLSEVAIEELRLALRNRMSVGSSWVLPSPKDAGQPCSRHIVRDWWKRGERLAGVERVDRRGWHSLRRKFATDLRTVLPLRDLCDAGGWRDSQTVLKCYQRPDEDLIRQALDARRTSPAATNRQDNRQETGSSGA